MEKDKLLTLEEFVKRDEIETPRYNSFIGYWSKGFVREVYRKIPYYLKFQKENPELDKKLFEKNPSRSLRSFSEQEKREYEQLMYEAYKIMKDYGISNKDLFA